MTTVRVITLSEVADPPVLTAECTDTGWNGFHVPALSAAELAAHFAACAAVQPDGWEWCYVDEVGDNIRLHTCESAGCITPDLKHAVTHDHSEDTLWPIELPERRAWIDGLVWGGHRHIGQCTTGPLFSRDDAERRLVDLGFTFNAERGDWQRGDEVAADGQPAERGRLAWQPDYCHPDDVERGARWWLSRPYRGGDIPLLP
ncbi:hypothetical protein GCM10027053_52180 [Intrasporangium mesophilum]